MDQERFHLTGQSAKLSGVCFVFGDSGLQKKKRRLEIWGLHSPKQDRSTVDDVNPALPFWTLNYGN